jgi:hypothetical protein
LTKVCREAQSLADGGGGLVDVELLAVCGAALEGNAGTFATNEDVPMNDADSLATGQDIEQGGLAGAGCTHECSESARLDIAKDAVEELTSAAWDWDGVVEALPGEGFGRLGDNHILFIISLASGGLAFLEALIKLLGLFVLLGVDGYSDGISAMSMEIDEYRNGKKIC